MKCSEEQIARFENDGFVIVEGVVSPRRLANVLAAMDRVYCGEYNADRRPRRLRKPVSKFGSEMSVHWILNARVLDQDLWELATDEGLGEMAAALLRTGSVSIVEDQLLAKPAHGLPVNMHQDRGYWAFSRSERMITAWIALVDMTAELGTLHFIRGSHRWGYAARPRELINGSETDWMSAVTPVRPADQDLNIAAAIIPAGAAVFFHSLTFHGSSRNETDMWRRAVSLHWAAEECRVDLAQTACHDYPYFFARLIDNGPIANNYMPVVFPAAARLPKPNVE